MPLSMNPKATGYSAGSAGWGFMHPTSGSGWGFMHPTPGQGGGLLMPDKNRWGFMHPTPSQPGVLLLNYTFFIFFLVKGSCLDTARGLLLTKVLLMLPNP